MSLLINMNFTIYSKTGCPYCKKVEQLLDLTNQSYVVYTLDQDFTKQEFYSEFGEGTTFPQVICNDAKIGGCSDTVKFLKEQKIV